MYYNFEVNNVQLKKYEGEFKDNNYEGKGKLYYSFEEIEMFKKKIKDFKIPNKDKIKIYQGKIGNIIKYEGDFKNNKYHGNGIIKSPTGNICYQGSFYKNYITIDTVSYGKSKDINIYFHDSHPLYKGGILDVGDENYDNINKLDLEEINNYIYSPKHINSTSCNCNECKKKYDKHSSTINYENINEIYYKFLGFKFIPNGNGQYYNIKNQLIKFRYLYLLEGNFNKGKLSGKCLMFYNNGKKYFQGNFVDNKANGLCYSYNNNDKNTISLDGIFKNNKLVNGTTYYYNEKKKYKGNFDYNLITGLLDEMKEKLLLNHKNLIEFCGNGKYFYNNDGNTVEYSGNFLKSKFHGFGTLYSSVGKIKYEGQWSNNYRNGEGKSYYDNGIIQYMGEWLNDNRNGEGTIFDSEGTMIVNGIFENNELVPPN